MNTAFEKFNKERESAANERAHRLANLAAEQVILTKGTLTENHNEVLIHNFYLDSLLVECVKHLAWNGRISYYEMDDGDILVKFVDITLT